MTQPKTTLGRVLANRYETEALIGRGGMGEVFRARDLTLGETVAVKVLSVDASDVIGSLARFKQEVRLARRITHPNVARVFDIVEDGEHLLLTMELVEGETLHSLLSREGALSTSRALRIARQICAGLAAVHAAGVVHRDLKPSNVLLERNHDTSEFPGRVVLADFGVARSTLEAASLGAIIVGTPRFMAPEQARGMAVDARADLYSFGVVLSDMLKGPPTDGPPRSEPMFVDPSLNGLIGRCCASEAAARPASATEVLAELDAWSGPDAAESAPPSAQEPSVKRPLAALEATLVRSVGPATLVSEPASRPSRSIVVLPFRVTSLDPSSSSDGSLGEVVAEELTDVLCTVRELRVVAPAAATRLDNARDPDSVHRALGVDAIVDGTIHIEGERVRITVRLIEAPSGKQAWRDQFDGNLSELFSFEHTIARRVAEALRTRVTVMAFDEGVPVEAVRLFLDARALHEGPKTTEKALEHLTRAIAIHPNFPPALSALALRSLVAWYVPFASTPPDWGETCAARVAQAERGAPSLAETHVASAELHLEHGDAREAELAVRRALQLAPTCVAGLQVLGELECQTNRVASGIAHTRRALDLNPGAVLPAVTLAREQAFAGQLALAMQTLDALGDDGWTPPPFLLRVRAAAWYRDHDTIRAWLRRGAGMSDASGRFHYGELVARALLGEPVEVDLDMLVDGLLGSGKSPRFCAETLRIAVEMNLAGGRTDKALERLRTLGDLKSFLDVGWLERCPALIPLASDPTFQRVREATWRRARAEG